jgi:uncharacterized protein
VDTGTQVTRQWAGLIARLRADVAAREHLLARRRTQAHALARMLIARFGARRVLLFGSLARGESAGKLDIDLAVEGLDRDLELRALAALSDEAGCAVDLVRVEDASPRLAAAIARDGVMLDERR